jgi:hypothetical protein
MLIVAVVGLAEQAVADRAVWLCARKLSLLQTVLEVVMQQRGFLNQ